MRIRRLISLLVFLAASSGWSQSPTNGKVTANSYVNSYFKFSYTWPRSLQPYNTASLHLTQSPYANEFLLFSAMEGDEPYGIVVIAERLYAATPHSRALRDGADLLNCVVATFEPEQHVVIRSRKHFTSPSAVPFDELDYTEDGQPSSAVAAHIGKFLIVFKCNAKSEAELEAMNRSAARIRLVR